jgi:hypothetical protein
MVELKEPTGRWWISEGLNVPIIDNYFGKTKPPQSPSPNRGEKNSSKFGSPGITMWLAG